jgi:hypothetical protein
MFPESPRIRRLGKHSLASVFHTPPD